MGSVSIWHWMVVFIFITAIVLMILAAKWTRDALRLADPKNRFWSPGFAWLAAIPPINMLFVPLNVWSIERTARADATIAPLGNDWLMRWFGWFLKWNTVLTLVVYFFQRIIDLYIYPNSAGAITGALEMLQIAGNVIVYVVIIGSVVSAFGYPIRLKTMLDRITPSPAATVGTTAPA